MLFDISNQVAGAIDLDSCARYRNAPQDDPRPLYGLNGHTKRGRFMFHCARELAEILIREIDAAAATSQESKFRELCASAIASMRKELDAPDTSSDRSYITPAVYPDGTRANGS